MLYEFNTFWKTIFILLFSWILYFILGFELTTVTLLAFLLVFQNKNT